MLVALTGLPLWFERNLGRGVQVARVAFIGIDMYFQLTGRVGAYEQVFERYATLWTLDAQRHEIAILDAVVLGVIVAHVNVSRGAYDSSG